MFAPATIVAVVEDEVHVRTALTRLLRATGFQAIAFATGEFLRHTDSQPPTCVVLDLHIPGVSGHEVQYAIVRRNLLIAVVVLTGNGSQEERTHSLTSGAYAFLSKPVDADFLIGTIRAAIEGRVSA